MTVDKNTFDFDGLYKYNKEALDVSGICYLLTNILEKTPRGSLKTKQLNSVFDLVERIPAEISDDEVTGCLEDLVDCICLLIKEMKGQEEKNKKALFYLCKVLLRKSGYGEQESIRPSYFALDGQQKVFLDVVKRRWAFEKEILLARERKKLEDPDFDPDFLEELQKEFPGMIASGNFHLPTASESSSNSQQSTIKSKSIEPLGNFIKFQFWRARDALDQRCSTHRIENVGSLLSIYAKYQTDPESKRLLSQLAEYKKKMNPKIIKVLKNSKIEEEWESIGYSLYQKLEASFGFYVKPGVFFSHSHIKEVQEMLSTLKKREESGYTITAQECYEALEKTIKACEKKKNYNFDGTFAILAEELKARLFPEINKEKINIKEKKKSALNEIKEKIRFVVKHTRWGY